LQYKLYSNIISKKDEMADCSGHDACYVSRDVLYTRIHNIRVNSESFKLLEVLIDERSERQVKAAHVSD